MNHTPAQNQTSSILWLELAALFAVMGNAVLHFSFVTVDPDLWGHVKFGKDLVNAGRLHHADIYSFTAAGHVWINHEWLAELIFWTTYRFFGDAGLLFGKLGLGLCMVALMWRCCQKQSSMAKALVMLPAVIVISPGFMVRPQVFSFLFFSIFVLVLHLFFKDKKNFLFILPLVMALWVNLHGGFLMGIAIFGAAVGWETITRGLFGKKIPELKKLWFWFFITCLAVLVNPYGYKLLVFLRHTLSIPRNISEWAPLCLTDFSRIQLKILMLLFAASLVTAPKKFRRWDVACILLTFYASMRHERHMPFFAIMVTPWLISWLSSIFARLRSLNPKLVLTRPSVVILTIAMVCAGVFLSAKGINRYVLSNCHIMVDPNSYPVAAVRYLKANKISGNLILPFDWGEYAIWHLHPKMRVSIDGRFRTSYPESLIQDHFAAFSDYKQWSRMEKYPGDVLLTRQKPFFKSMIKPNLPWVCIYSDPTAIIFLRDNEKNKKYFVRFSSPGFVNPKEPVSAYFP